MSRAGRAAVSFHAGSSWPLLSKQFRHHCRQTPFHHQLRHMCAPSVCPPGTAHSCLPLAPFSLLFFPFSSMFSLSLCLSTCLSHIPTPTRPFTPLFHHPPAKNKKPLALTLLGMMCLLSGIPGRVRKVPISPFFFHPFTKCLGTVVQSLPRWMTR